MDTVSWQLTLPEQKLQAKINNLLQLCLSKDIVRKWEIQSIIGKLSFACHVIYGGRTFLRQIIDFCKKLSNPYSRVRLNNSIKADLY